MFIYIYILFSYIYIYIYIHRVFPFSSAVLYREASVWDFPTSFPNQPANQPHIKDDQCAIVTAHKNMFRHGVVSSTVRARRAFGENHSCASAGETCVYKTAQLSLCGLRFVQRNLAHIRLRQTRVAV